MDRIIQDTSKMMYEELTASVIAACYEVINELEQTS